MIFDFKLNNGVVFGIEAEPLMCFDEEEEQFFEIPCISIHLSVVSLMFIFD